MAPAQGTGLAILEKWLEAKSTSKLYKNEFIGICFSLKFGGLDFERERSKIYDFWAT